MSLLTPIFDMALRPFRQRKPQAVSRPVSSHVGAAALAGMGFAEPKEIGQLVALMRRDAQVRLAELVLTSNVKSIPVAFAPGDNAPRTALLASKLRTLWDNTLTDALDFIAHGRVAFEKVWDYSEGLTIYKSLDAMPFSRTALDLGDYGEYAGFTLKAEEPVYFSAEKSWWLALDAKPLEPHGTSRFLGAPYEVWKERCEAFKLRRLFLKRYAIVGAMAHIPMLVNDPETGRPIDNGAEFASRLNDLLSAGWLLMPNTRDGNGNLDYSVTFPEVGDPGPIDDVIDGLDAEQLRAFGIPEKTIIEGTAVGSYALGDQQMLILYCVVEDILSQLVKSFQRYVINKLVAINGTGPIAMTFQKITEAKRQQELAQPLPDGTNTQVGGADPAAATVQDTAMNGAQVTSLLSITTALSEGTLPPDAARGLIDASFPALRPEQIEAIVAPFGAAAATVTKGSGSLTGIGQQERNNRMNSALKSLQKMIDGSVSEAMTRIFLGGLNFTAEEIDKMILDAQDGKVDDPELQGVG